MGEDAMVPYYNGRDGFVVPVLEVFDGAIDVHRVTDWILLMIRYNSAPYLPLEEPDLTLEVPDHYGRTGLTFSTIGGLLVDADRGILATRERSVRGLDPVPLLGTHYRYGERGRVLDAELRIDGTPIDGRQAAEQVADRVNFIGAVLLGIRVDLVRRYSDQV